MRIPLPRLSQVTCNCAPPSSSSTAARLGSTSSTLRGFLRQDKNAQSRSLACCEAWLNDAGTNSKDGEGPTIRPTWVYASDYATRPASSDSPQEPMTVYSLRFETGSGKLSALPCYSSVNVLLLSWDGSRSIMHNVSPLSDPAETLQNVKDICNAVGSGDADIGANCLFIYEMESASVSVSRTSERDDFFSPPTPAPLPCKLRFQGGCVDEVSFLAPELGPLSGILIGTESGSWVLDEVQVSSSRTGNSDRFVCRRRLGSNPGQGAAWLTPTPQEAAVIGNRDDSIIVNKPSDQRAVLQAAWDKGEYDEYISMKNKVLSTTVQLAAGGSAIAGLIAGNTAAIPFAAGGIVGVTYLWLLQQGLDSLRDVDENFADIPEMHKPIPWSDELRTESGRPTSSDLPEVSNRRTWSDGLRTESGLEGAFADITGSTSVSIAQQLIEKPSVRLSLLVIGSYLGTTMTMHLEAQKVCEETMASCAPAISSNLPVSWQLVLGMVGFLTYKLALVGVAIPHNIEADNMERSRAS